MAQQLTRMPPSFSAGSTVAYTRSVPDYPATSGWTLTVYLAGVSVLSQAAAGSGSSFVVTLTAAGTLPLTPGNYTWLERVSNGAGEVHDVGTGVVAVLANVATAAAGALQSWEEKVIAALETALLDQAGSTMISYQIHGRAMQFMERGKAIAELDALKRRVNRRRNGGKLGRAIGVRFQKPGCSGGGSW